MKKPTIAWLIAGNEGYGVRQAVLQLTRELGANGWETPIVSLFDEEFAEECRTLGYPVRSLNVGKSPAFAGGLLAKPFQILEIAQYQKRVAPAVAKELEAVSAEAVHTLWPNLVRLAGIAASKRGIPVFWEMPNILSDRYILSANRWMYQYTCWKYDILPLANSLSTAATLGDWPVRPEVLYLGVDAERFDPEKVVGKKREELGIPQDAIVFGIVSRLTPFKGQDRVLQALLSLGEHDPPLHLLLLGGPTDDEFADSLRAIAKAENASDRLHLIGPVDDTERYYGECDVVVNSYTGREAFGISVVEAMMMQTPVLVHASGGPAETVLDGETGWHIPDASVETIARGVRRVLGDRSRWKEIGVRARQHSIENFSKECQAESYGAIVERVLKSHRGEK